jgi:Ferritin-like domain
MAGHVSVKMVRAPDPTADAEIPRAEFLKKAVVAGGAIAAGGVLLTGLPRLSSAAPSPSAGMDVEILNFLLMLERLQTAFYEDAIGRGSISGEMAEFAQTVLDHERAHVEHLEKVLGGDADAEPSFDFGDSTGSDEAFGKAALLIEETTSAAYIGQGPNLTRDKILAASRIVSVEARHTAWMSDILRLDPAPHAADVAMSEQDVKETLRKEGFIA